MKRQLTFVLAIVLFGAVYEAESAGFHVAKEEWVARYNDPYNGTDYTTGIAVDHSDNVYMTGYSEVSDYNYDYVTIKYATDGNELWIARYNGTGDSRDYAQAIAIDSYGNIYVTGKSIGADGDDDFATIKYDTNGTELWVARWDGPGDLGTHVADIALDDLGNVYVLGYSRIGDTSEDYVTLKYDPNGNEVWEAVYDGPRHDYFSSDHARAMTVDSFGNVYVTGRSIGLSSSNYDYATIKYAPDSNVSVWVARYDGPGSDSEEVTGIAVDSAGNVYVTGESENLSQDGDYATVKYDPNGTEAWVARHDGGMTDTPYSLVIDSSDNVYVTGVKRAITTETASSDICTIKYDPNGNELWKITYNGPDNRGDSGKDIATDADGNVYVTGINGTLTGDADYITIKYDPNGNEVWVAKYNGPGNYIDRANGIVIDSSLNVYIKGESWGDGTNADYATIKYAQLFCTAAINGDLNGDCAVNFFDLAKLCESWLECNLEPPEACWE